MSILQEYEAIRKEVGEYEWSLMDEYCFNNEILLSDVLYNKDKNEEFQKWKHTSKRNDIMNHLWNESTKIMNENNDLSDCKVAYILINKKDIRESFVAVGNDEDYYQITPLKDNLYQYANWDYNFDIYFFENVQDDILAYVSNETHYNLWCSIMETYPIDLENKEGLQQYLKFCKDNHVTKESIEKNVGLEVMNVMKYQHNEPVYLEDKTILMAGIRTLDTKIALIEKDLGNSFHNEYVIAVDYEVKDNDVTWGYGIYYGNDYKKAMRDFERAKSGQYLTGKLDKTKNDEREGR